MNFYRNQNSHVDKKRLAKAFSRSTTTYNAFSSVQKNIAGMLEQKAQTFSNETIRNVLDVGCGTGLLTQRLQSHFHHAHFFITDISESMLKSCQQRLLSSRSTFVCLDGEQLPFHTPCFDLIVSNLAMQWFHKAEKAIQCLAQLLMPGGRFLFSLLGEKTFQEWKKAHQHFGLQAGTPPFPSCAFVRSACKNSKNTIHIKELLIKKRYDDVSSFLHSLKNVGAQTPVKGHKSLPIKEFKNIIAYLGKNFFMTYHVFLASLTRKRTP